MTGGLLAGFQGGIIELDSRKDDEMSYRITGRTSSVSTLHFYPNFSILSPHYLLSWWWTRSWKIRVIISCRETIPILYRGFRAILKCFTYYYTLRLSWATASNIYETLCQETFSLIQAFKIHSSGIHAYSLNQHQTHAAIAHTCICRRHSNNSSFLQFFTRMIVNPWSLSSQRGKLPAESLFSSLYRHSFSMGRLPLRGLNTEKCAFIQATEKLESCCSSIWTKELCF